MGLAEFHLWCGWALIGGRACGNAFMALKSVDQLGGFFGVVGPNRYAAGHCGISRRRCHVDRVGCRCWSLFF